VRNIILKLVHIIMQTAGANYGCVMLSQQTMERKKLYIEVIGNGNKIDLVNHRPLKSQTEVVPTRLCEYGAFLLLLILGLSHDLEKQLFGMEILRQVIIASTRFTVKIPTFGTNTLHRSYVCQSQSLEVRRL
jgi:hypothetical protein